LKVNKEARVILAKSFAAIGVAASALLASAPAQAVAVPMPVDGDAARALQIIVDRPLKFGGFVLGSGAGSVTVTADQFPVVTSVNAQILDQAGPRGANSGKIRLVGEPDFDVRISDLLSNIPMTCTCGGTMNYAPTDSVPANRIVRLPITVGGAAAEYTYYIGGTASFAAGAPSGRYSAVVTLDANYY